MWTLEERIAVINSLLQQLERHPTAIPAVGEMLRRELAKIAAGK